jgi:hypothetical protein
MLRRCSLIGLWIGFATACGAKPPTAPQPVTAQDTPVASAPSIPTSYAGVWHAYLQAIDCLTPDTCNAPVTTPFVLRIAALGADFTASFEITTESTGSVVLTLSGSPQADGSLLFTGTRGPIESNVNTSFNVRRLSVKTGVSGLTGDVDVLRTGAVSRTLKGAITSASYQPFTSLSGQSFSGNWSGYAIIRTCSGFCPIFRDPGDLIGINLTFAQSGNQITGSIREPEGYTNWVPLAGSVGGTSVSVTSQTTQMTGGGQVTTFTLEQFNGTPDALGRLSGTLTYSETAHIAISPFNVSYRLGLEILWLKRD